MGTGTVKRLLGPKQGNGEAGGGISWEEIRLKWLSDARVHKKQFAHALNRFNSTHCKFCGRQQIESH